MVWPLNWEIADFQHQFLYNISIGTGGLLTGGRHHRRGGGDPTNTWGKDNVAMADGHVRSHVSMEWLVTNVPTGTFYSYPFNAASERFGPNPDDRPAGAEFGLVPWW